MSHREEQPGENCKFDPPSERIYWRPALSLHGSDKAAGTKWNGVLWITSRLSSQTDPPLLPFPFEGRTAGARQTQRHYIREKQGGGEGAERAGRERRRDRGEWGWGCWQAPGIAHCICRFSFFQNYSRAGGEKQGERKETWGYSFHTAPISVLFVEIEKSSRNAGKWAEGGKLGSSAKPAFSL